MLYTQHLTLGPSKTHDQRLLRLRNLLQDIVQAAAAGLAQLLALAVPRGASPWQLGALGAGDLCELLGLGSGMIWEAERLMMKFPPSPRN